MKNSASRSRTSKNKVLLTVAGFDPGGGAGILLDVASFRHNGFQGAAVITSLTAQNTREIKDTFLPPPDFVWSQYRVLAEDINVSGIKIGMLGSRKNILHVSGILSENQGIPKVVDPVFRSTSGTWLLEKKAVPEFMESISEKTDLITPNIPEAALILGESINSIEEAGRAAFRIFHNWGIPCLIKGGHLAGKVRDILYDGERFHQYEGQRIEKSVHGTGCFLSSSLLSMLATGMILEKACAAAIEATRRAVAGAVSTGHGQHVISLLPGETGGNRD